MKTLVFTIALLSLAFGLRSASSRLAQKLGALVMIAALAQLGWVLSGHWAGAVGMLLICAAVPLVFIYWQQRGQTYAMQPCPLPAGHQSDATFYPHASQYLQQLEQLEFEPISEGGWRWLESCESHRLMWNPECDTIASVCLCEQGQIAFSYVTFYSERQDGTLIQTTNYPFSSKLRLPAKVHRWHVPCEEKEMAEILRRHQQKLVHTHHRPTQQDPDTFLAQLRQQLSEQAQYNAESGLITTQDDQFSYSSMGILYLWAQAVKDFIRLC